MLQALRRILNPSVSDSLANAFSRLGWTGFWIQIVIGIVPLALIIYAQSSGGTTRRGTLLVGYLTIAGFLVLIFTTVWFYRYTRLAERISNSTLRPKRTSESTQVMSAFRGKADIEFKVVMSAYDPKRTWAARDFCSAN